MSITNSTIQQAKEKVNHALFGTSFVNRTRKLGKLAYQSAASFGSDANLYLDSAASTVTNQVQAIGSYLKESVGTTVPNPASLATSNSPSLFQTAKETLQVIDKHPLTKMFRRTLVVKSAIDLTMATKEYLYSQRSLSSLLYFGANTALSTVPLILLDPSGTIGTAANVALLGCLSYSIGKDLYATCQGKPRESSPSVRWLNQTAFPSIKSYFGY